MLRGRSGLIKGIVAALAVVLAALLYPSEEKAVLKVADALVDAANGGPSALSEALVLHASPEVSVSVDGLPEPLQGRLAIVAALQQANDLGPKPRIRMEAVNVTVEGKRARLTADFSASQAEVPELRRPRHGVLLFEKQDSFRLVSAEIGPERRDQPEARP